MDLSGFYERYGESLARRLADIAFSEANASYLFVENMGDPAEVLAHISSGKTQEGKALLVWENFEEDLDTGGRDNYHTVIQGSVAVIRKAGDRAAIREAKQIGRAVVLKVLALMLQDEVEGSLYEQTIRVEIRQRPLQAIGPISTNWYGYALQFSWIVPIDLSLSDTDLLTA